MGFWSWLVSLFGGIPAQVPVPGAEICICPNIGSLDMLAMFASPDPWAASRALVKAWKWYGGIFIPGYGLDGPNTYAALAKALAFSKLRGWGIRQGIECGCVKEWDCTGAANLANAKTAIAALKAAGGTVDFISMDEPLDGGEFGKTVVGSTTYFCGLTQPQILPIVRTFVSTLKQENPGLLIGDIEPYPTFSAAQLAAWVAEAPLDYFQVDMDIGQEVGKPPGQTYTGPISTATFAKVMNTISAACAAKKIPFGVIIWGNGFTDANFYALAAAGAKVLEQSKVPVQQVVFQSWQATGVGTSDALGVWPHNLPETGPNTMTELVLNYQRGKL